MFAEYNPSYIIPDDVFSNYNSMDQATIQSFLSSRGSFLAGYTIPNDVYIGPDNTDLVPAGTSASRLIYLAAQWYQINPQVIIVTLQKEQSAITSNPQGWLGQTDCAMGYEAGRGCDWMYENRPQWRGFAHQVDMGTWQLKFNYERSGGNNSYYSSLTYSSYMVGQTYNISGSNIYIGNKSTASLYSYTPYNTYGGNFRTYFTNWFGSIDYTGGVTYVYRFLNSNGTHFYTASESEKNNIIARWPGTYKYEGIAYGLNYGSGRNTAPLYRFYVASSGTHFYSANPAEVANINARWGYKYRFEGVAYHVSLDSSNSTPVYRFYKNDGTHFYTASATERDNVNARWGYIYRYEGIAYFIPN